MARITVDLPERFPFATEIAIYINHINYGNHLDNSAVLALVSEARVRYFRSMGYGELDVEGVGIIIADAAIQYKSEAHHGEVLTFRMAAADFNKYGCDLVWQAAAGEREVARGKTGIIFFDYGAKRPVPVPANFLRRTAP